VRAILFFEREEFLFAKIKTFHFIYQTQTDRKKSAEEIEERRSGKESNRRSYR
jgi:hypothetical protein